MNCYYKILNIPKHTDYFEFAKEYMVDYAKTKSYSVTFIDLKMGTDYTASVQSYYDNTRVIRTSNKTKLNFSTPTCLVFKHYDWNSCGKFIIPNARTSILCCTHKYTTHCT